MDFILCADSNRLDLSPILDLSPDLCQVVKVPTRLDPPATLDTILTSLSRFYKEPVTKYPIMSDSLSNGKPSDHLVVLWEPIQTCIAKFSRVYRTVELRPLTNSGLSKFSEWINDYSWHDLYKCENIHSKAIKFQDILLEKYYEFFPLKKLKVCD